MPFDQEPSYVGIKHAPVYADHIRIGPLIFMVAVVIPGPLNHALLSAECLQDHKYYSER